MYDGRDAATIARLVGVPRVVVFDSTASTMDDAHSLAAVDAPAGTVVIADRQAAGRGRNGRRWASESAQGIWMTIIERPNDPRAIDVLSLRARRKHAPQHRVKCKRSPFVADPRNFRSAGPQCRCTALEHLGPKLACANQVKRAGQRS